MSIDQSYTITPVVRMCNLRKKTNTIKIEIRVTIDRKSSFRATSYAVHPNQWDVAKAKVFDHPNEKLINANIASQISEIEKEILGQHLQGNKVTRRILKALPSSTSFRKFAEEVRGKNTITTKECNRIENYFGSDPFLTDIDDQFLRKFQTHEKDRGMDGNTIHGSFKFLRRILKQAKKEKLIQENPMEDFLFPEYVQPDVTYLEDAEKDKIVKLIDETLWSARNTSDTALELCTTAVYFLAACYTGLRHSDWHKTKEMTMLNNNLLLRAKKNKKMVSLPVGPTLRKLLQKIKQLPAPPNLHDSNEFLKIIGTMAKLKKDLTTHVGRHSFGCMCASLGIPREVTAELMGVSLQTVAVYYHLTGESIAFQSSKLRAV